MLQFPIQQPLSLARLAQQTGIAESKLQELIPSEKMKDGLILPGFSLVIPEGYAKGPSPGAGAVAQAMMEAPGRPDTGSKASLVGLRTEGTIDHVQSQRAEVIALAGGYRAEFRGLEGAWYESARVAEQQARSQAQRNSAVFDAQTALGKVEDIVSSLVAHVQRGQPFIEFEGNHKNLQDAREAHRRAPHVAAEVIRRIFSALPQMLDVPPEPKDYFHLTRALAKDATDFNKSPAERGAALDRLAQIGKDLVTHGEEVVRAKQKFESQVHALDEKLKTLSGRLIQIEIQANAVHHPNSPLANNPAKANEMLAALKDALQSAQVLRSDGEQLSSLLEGEGRGARGLRFQLDGEVSRVTDAVVAKAVRDVLNAWPRMLGSKMTPADWPEQKDALAKKVGQFPMAGALLVQQTFDALTRL